MVPSAATGAQTFKAGAGAADILTSASMFPVAEFAGQHDPVSTRVLLLEDSDHKIAILTVDTPSVQVQSITGRKAILTKATGTKPEDALVIGTHTTPSPHVSSGGGPGAGGCAGAGQTAGVPSGARPGNPGGPVMRDPEALALISQCQGLCTIR